MAGGVDGWRSSLFGNSFTFSLKQNITCDLPYSVSEHDTLPSGISVSVKIYMVTMVTARST